MAEEECWENGDHGEEPDGGENDHEGAQYGEGARWWDRSLAVSKLEGHSGV